MSEKRYRVSVVLFCAFAAALPALGEVVPPGTDDEIRARLMPSGEICRAGEQCGSGAATAALTGGGPRSGEDVYSQFCFVCHATGASNAPIFADAEAWAPRIAKGTDELISTTINGLGLMPPKGACMDCSDEDLRAAVDYMTSSVK